jgi:hypothetical protein
MSVAAISRATLVPLRAHVKPLMDAESGKLNNRLSPFKLLVFNLNAVLTRMAYPATLIICIFQSALLQSWRRSAQEN